jgi:hypothetical protein
MATAHAATTTLRFWGNDMKPAERRQADQSTDRRTNQLRPKTRRSTSDAINNRKVCEKCAWNIV